MAVDIKQTFCAEMRRLVEGQLAVFDDSLSSSAARSNWLGPRGDCLTEEPCRAALRSMLKVELTSLCLGFASALDGATAMSDHGQPLFLADAAGRRETGELMSALTDDFEDHLD